jgi:hypothetical protein
VRPLDPSRFLVCNADGTRIPLVMVTVWWEDDQRVRALAEAIGPDQPIVAVLTPPLVDGRLPATAHAWAERIGPAFDELAEPENVGSLAAALRSRLDALDAALAQ